MGFMAGLFIGIVLMLLVAMFMGWRNQQTPPAPVVP